MAKYTLTLEDDENGGVDMSIETEVEGVTLEEGRTSLTPAAIALLGARTLFSTGLMMEAGMAGVTGIAEGQVPSECVLHHFKTKKWKN